MMFGEEWVGRVLAEYLGHSVLVLNYQYRQLCFCSFLSLRKPCLTYTLRVPSRPGAGKCGDQRRAWRHACVE